MSGFVHRNRRIYALQYELEAEPPQGRQLIVWLTPEGRAERHFGRRLDRRPIVVTKPGEVLLLGDKEAKVLSVAPYRWVEERV